MGRYFINRSGTVGAMSLCFWTTCCCFFFFIVTTHANTHQNEHPLKGITKRHSLRTPLSSASGLSLQSQQNIPESLRSARSSLGLPLSSTNRDNDAFWAMRGKRPVSSDGRSHQDESSQNSRYLSEKEIGSDPAEVEVYADDKGSDDDRDPSDADNASEKATPLDDFTFPQDKEVGGKDAEEEEEEASADSDMQLQKRNQPYWIARGKKGIRDYLPFYWGSNQNVFGKMPLRRTLVSADTIDPIPSSNVDLSHLPSGWESNQSLWGKRSENGPFWISRGKKQDTETGPYWVARGKRPLYTDQYYGATPFALGKRTNEGEIQEDTATLENSNLTQKRANTPTLINGGEKSTLQESEDNSPFWVSRGRRSENNTFWVTRGKKYGAPNPFWVARGKKQPEEKSPFWVARGKKAEDTDLFWIARGKKKSDTSPFWISRGKKDNDETPFWIARGKKDNDETPFWIARGKKDNDETPFWIARGKKDKDTPYWIARGKKESETPPTFWVARGKKESNNPFWVARGKKEDSNPYWISRGKKDNPTSYLLNNEDQVDTNPFWVARGKKEGDNNPYWIARGKKEEDTPPFWVSRGKKAASDTPYWIARGKKEDPEEDDGSFWISRGRRTFWTSRGKRPLTLQGKKRQWPPAGLHHGNSSQ